MAKGKDFKKILRKNGFRQHELASVVGVSECTMCRWLRDDNEIPKRRERMLREGVEKLTEKYL